MNTKIKAYALLLTAVLLWSSNLIFGRYLHDTLPPFGISFWRWIFALIAVSLINWKNFYNFCRLFKRYFLQLFLLSFFGIVLSATLQYVGLAYTTATNAGIIAALMPVSIAICAELILKEKTTKLQKLGMLISICGTMILICKGNLNNLRNLNFNYGDLILLIAALAWGIYTALLKKFKLPCSHWELIQGTACIGAILIGLVLLSQGQATLTATFTLSGTSLLALLYLGIFASLFAFRGWNLGVALVGANRAGIFLYLFPVFSALLALIFLHEQLHLYHFIGALVIFVGIYLTLKRNNKH